MEVKEKESYEPLHSPYSSLMSLWIVSVWDVPDPVSNPVLDHCLRWLEIRAGDGQQGYSPRYALSLNYSVE